MSTGSSSPAPAEAFDRSRITSSRRVGCPPARNPAVAGISPTYLGDAAGAGSAMAEAATGAGHGGRRARKARAGG